VIRFVESFRPSRDIENLMLIANGVDKIVDAQA
jgi:hypothetical protein